MSESSKPKGPWLHRFFIHALTVALAVLIFWLLGFFLEDIQAIRGPQYPDIEKRHVSQQAIDTVATLDSQIAELARRIDNQQEEQRLVGDSSRNLQQTINQLLDLQRLAIEKEVVFSETEQANFANSMNLFLENQTKYQELNQSIAELLRQRQSLEVEKRQAEQEIEAQRTPAREEYARLYNAHRLKLAFMQLALLIPILAVAAVLMVRKRSSIYFPICLALGAATLVKAGVVIHKYFPARYFKYILILALLIVVLRILIHFIRMIAFPKAQWLVKQYREAYERFLCPVCEYPIRTGPRRFLFWTRRTVNRNVMPDRQGEQEEAYTCPACGTALFEECDACHKVRHSLLPHCGHCGATKAIG